jgi:hypothetical protein
MTPLVFYYLFQILDPVRLTQPHQWLNLPVLLVDDLSVLEVISELEGALVTRIADVADLWRFILLPLLEVELLVELLEVRSVDEVNESITNIAVILKLGKCLHPYRWADKRSRIYSNSLL